MYFFKITLNFRPKLHDFVMLSLFSSRKPIRDLAGSNPKHSSSTLIMCTSGCAESKQAVNSYPTWLGLGYNSSWMSGCVPSSLTGWFNCICSWEWPLKPCLSQLIFWTGFFLWDKLEDSNSSSSALQLCTSPANTKKFTLHRLPISFISPTSHTQIARSLLLNPWCCKFCNLTSHSQHHWVSSKLTCKRLQRQTYRLICSPGCF